jgi:hypothetical protein
MQVDDQDDHDDHWPAWDPAIFVGNNPPQQSAQPQHENQPLEHPAVPQDLIDVDLSGSSMRFLQATGPDIALEDVFNGLASDDNSSSSSSDATSAMDEDYARFLAAQSHCATISIFHRRGIQAMSLLPSLLSPKLL